MPCNLSHAACMAHGAGGVARHGYVGAPSHVRRCRGVTGRCKCTLPYVCPRRVFSLRRHFGCKVRVAAAATVYPPSICCVAGSRGLGESWLLLCRVSGFRFARGCGSACGAVRTTRAEASPIGGPVQGQPPKAPPPNRCHGNSNRQISENRGRTLLRKCSTRAHRGRGQPRPTQPERACSV